MDAIQKYQDIKQKHRQVELNIARAKAQADIYRKDIEKILAEEQVSSIEELNSKFQSKQEELKAITSVLEQEVGKAELILSQIGLA